MGVPPNLTPPRVCLGVIAAGRLIARSKAQNRAQTGLRRGVLSIRGTRIDGHW
jgi:hypothetical protein